MRTRHPFIVMILTAVASPAVLHAAEKFENYAETIPGTLVKFEMVAVPFGTIDFAIGAETPRRVDVKRFWIGKTEVTWNELDVFMYGLDIPRDRLRMEALVRGFEAGTRASRSYGDPTWDFGRDGYPALSITLHHAQKYCEWLSQKTGRKYRLPTDVEWEYACRAGAPERARASEELDEIAWHRENSPTTEFEGGKTHPVATKKPNAFGLHDTLGNAWEWCTSADGKPVARGGSWAEKPDQVHCRARFTRIAMWAISDPMEPKSRWWLSDGNSIGFRIVREE